MARRSKRPGSGDETSNKKVTPASPLEMVRDSEGAVILGWVGEGVFYSRFIGTLSAELGDMVASQLKRALSEVPLLRYFSDASELQSYDLLARSALTRVILANRKRFGDIVILTWAEGINAAERGLAAAIGDPIVIVTDRSDFETRLLRAAPFAKQTIDPRNWTHAGAPRA